MSLMDEAMWMRLFMAVGVSIHVLFMAFTC